MPREIWTLSCQQSKRCLGLQNGWREELLYWCLQVILLRIIVKTLFLSRDGLVADWLVSTE